jgi:excisionase family DNA binding protein
VEEARVLLSLSRSTFYELVRAGRLLTVTEGRRRFVPLQAINAYVQELINKAETGKAADVEAEAA